MKLEGEGRRRERFAWVACGGIELRASRGRGPRRGRDSFFLENLVWRIWFDLRTIISRPWVVQKAGKGWNYDCESRLTLEQVLKKRGVPRYHSAVELYEKDDP